MKIELPPLDGLTVLDFSHALAGPYCTMLMAAYGAKVIKVESPEGDIGRTWGPPFHGADASYFVGLNSGKQTLFAAVEAHKIGGVGAVKRRSPGASDVSLRAFNLDHLGAVRGHQHGAIRPRQRVGES